MMSVIMSLLLNVKLISVFSLLKVRCLFVRLVFFAEVYRVRK